MVTNAGASAATEVLISPSYLPELFNICCVTSGYFGSICASDFGVAVPVIPVQIVPFFGRAQF